MPYLKNYTKILENDFDIIYWNQYNLDEQTGAMHQYQFNYEIPSNGSARARKALGYIKFRSFALKLIRRNNYDALIVLLTKTGFLFYRTLIKHFRNKFILDIRDYTAENNPLVYRFEKNLIECSGFTVISSPAYTHFLPNGEYVVSHNKTDVDSSLIQSYRINNHRKKEQITISCIGSIRFIDQFKKFIASFKGDNRFRIKFIGRGAEALEEFCKNNGFNNVTLIGRFESEDTTKYYMDTDIIMNLYGNGDPFLDYALSNKLYYAATFGMPFIRYQTGDTAIWKASECKCGRKTKTLVKIEGRDEDFVITPEGSRIMRFDYIFKDSHNIKEAQVVQSKLGSVTIRIVRRKGYSKSDEKMIKDEMALRISPSLEVEFEYVNDIERTSTGKFRAVVSLLEKQAAKQ